MAGQPLSEHALRVARTYEAAADHYGLPSLSFWDRFGAATVSRLPLAAGASVLDLCCGAGASAIRAAHAVGPAGAVLGIDLAAPFGAGDHDAGGGDTGQACQSQHFPPAHLLRLDHARREH